MSAARLDQAICAPMHGDDYGSVYGSLYSKFPQEAKTAGSRSLGLLKSTQQSHETRDPAVDEIVFRLVTESEMAHSSVDCGNGRVTLSGRKGSFYLAPADAESSWEAEGDHRLLMLALPKAQVSEILATDSGLSNTDPLQSLYNSEVLNGVIPNLMNRIWDHTVLDGPGASLQVDGLFLSLLGTLAGIADAVTTPADVLPLDAKRLLRVTDYVDANLENSVSLEDLAAVADLSQFHFSRCFKLATNTTPHMFVTSRRVEAARVMLANPDQTLADIAYACGFSSQAYFTTKFKEYTSVTPGVYRTEICG